MPRKRYSSEQIILQLREAEVELAKGQTTAPTVPLDSLRIHEC